MTAQITIPRLETDRLILRAHTLSDFPDVAAFYATDHSKFVGGPMTPELAWRSLAMEAGHWLLRGFGRWSIIEKASDQWIGITGLWYPEGFPEHELGWDLAEHATGKGYATEAARAARAYAYDTLGWTTLISLVAEGNDASAAVATRLGARPDGRFTHERFGAMNVYRHPAPEALA
ncbi:GNAT family N-acetyltransferase [Aestuariivita sp.]|jgi:RimJ/RimL family protein N-acetyltransferase|uniref:GNAT family N-acetyltransferase n=1 Tax=Aestuariivita sp. TaxID=1872407 RepID=UPI002170ED63|nr:GNAT family N-acetyltransferase [Aestuariivita sp.]MCE8007291.1 GNAT family N-acetyltransferase [Aestuariivita sp.]